MMLFLLPMMGFCDDAFPAANDGLLRWCFSCCLCLWYCLWCGSLRNMF